MTCATRRDYYELKAISNLIKTIINSISIIDGNISPNDINSLIYRLNESQRLELLNLFTKFKQEGILKNVYDKFTIEDVIEEVISINEYELLRRLSSEAAEIGETTISTDRWGVHETHCCTEHGCKYGDVDCPVSLEITVQRYACENCNKNSDYFNKKETII